MPHAYSTLIGPRRNGGFSFLALSLTLALLGAALALGLPYGRQTLIRHRAQETAAHLRSFATIFQTYANENGDWPAGDGTPAGIPRGMEKVLSNTRWSAVSPIGGCYTWEPSSLQQGSRIRAAIVIASTGRARVSSDRAQLLAIDRALDDGDLTTGNFLLGYRNFPLFVLER